MVILNKNSKVILSVVLFLVVEVASTHIVDPVPILLLLSQSQSQLPFLLKVSSFFQDHIEALHFMASLEPSTIVSTLLFAQSGTSASAFSPFVITPSHSWITNSGALNHTSMFKVVNWVELA